MNWLPGSFSANQNILIPETKDIHFVSIMGGGGQCFGLATYRGIRGLMFLQDILSGEEINDPRTPFASASQAITSYVFDLS